MSIRFQPWIGSNYGPRSRFGMSVMLLGLSHYREFEDVELQNYTQHVLRRHIEGSNDRSRYWTKCARTVSRKMERAEFWDSVIFYNYVQDFVGSGPRKDPTLDQLATSWGPFLRVVTQHQPDVIIATGKFLWEVLSEKLPHTKTQRRNGRDLLYAKLLEAAPGAGILGYINHPSSGGYCYATWRPIVEALMEIAAEEATLVKRAMEPDDNE